MDDLKRCFLLPLIEKRLNLDNADLEEHEELLATGDELQDTDVELLDSGNEVPPIDDKQEAARERAISRLIGFSLILIIVPLTAMYFSYRFIFTGNWFSEIFWLFYKKYIFD